MVIPHILHQVWIGDSQPTPLHELCITSLRERHASWDYVFWDNEDILNHPDVAELQIASLARELGKEFVKRSDLIRYVALYLYGGVYADVDVFAVGPLEPLLDRPFLYGEHGTYDEAEPIPGEGRKANALIGCPPRSEIMWKVLEYAVQTGKVDIHAFSEALAKMADVPAALPYQVFFPHYWTQKEHRYRIFPETTTVHCWRRLSYDPAKLTALSKTGQ